MPKPFRRSADTTFILRAFAFIWLGAAVLSWVLSDLEDLPHWLVGLLTATVLSLVSAIAFRKWVLPAKNTAQTFQDIFEKAPLPVAIVSLEGHYLHANEPFAELLGLPMSEIIGKATSDFAHAEEIERDFGMLKDLVSGRRHRYTVEKRYPTAGGEWVWVVLTTHLVTDEQGQPKYLISFYTDITERKNLEDALMRREIQFRALFDTAPMGIIMLDSERRFLKANNAYQKITGYTEDELRKLTIFDITHPEHMEETEKVSFQLLSGPGARVNQLQKPKRRKDGSTVWVQVTSTQLDHVAGIEPGTVVSVVEDVTEKRRITSELERKTQEALQEKSNFETFVYGLNHSAGVVLTDRASIITYANEKFCQMSGYEPEELIGQNVELVRSHFHSPEFYAELGRALASSQVWHGELCNRTKAGESFWVEGSIVPVTDNEGLITHFVAVYFDITVRKAAEKNLVYSSKMASLGEMSSGLAHEINNPLAIIQGKVQKLLELTEAPSIESPVLRRDLDRIHVTTERIARIVRGLRAFSRQGDADPFEPTPLRDVILQTLDLCAERFKSKGVLVVMCEIPEVTLTCRATEISQVLLNLLNNAFDAVRGLDEKWIRVEIRSAEKDAIEILVTDSGPGIPDVVADRIMQPFFTTKPVGQGTGLGLSISRGIIETHGGTLRLDRSSPHTRFIIQLPLSPTNVARDAA